MAGKSTVQWHLKLRMPSPWLIKGGSDRATANASALTDLLGYPYIPASTIKGQLRHQHRLLSSIHPQLKNWETFFFGESGIRHGHLYITDATLTHPLHPEQLRQYRSRIAIDRKRKVVSDQALLTEEVIIPGIELGSELMCYVPPDQTASAAAILTLCILNIRSIGSSKSIGYGHLRFRYHDDQANPSPDDSTVQVVIDNCPWTYDRFLKAVRSTAELQNP
ncbi:MAG: hypothetical protein BAA01_01170 [Bacillus thermozeamaize]|uniref:CRISPR type III-associated protein domain-containing protein n=1 Tax=Bacillus thermozeamaize TaxID=230954 RepID=A0A1Y3PFS6_9BACI|nr:MAG: hypothetical protein BAA01_01170 [Bacillus thermozeamaize]